VNESPVVRVCEHKHGQLERNKHGKEPRGIDENRVDYDDCNLRDAQQQIWNELVVIVLEIEWEKFE
jgi:hypothetical protein